MLKFRKIPKGPPGVRIFLNFHILKPRWGGGGGHQILNKQIDPSIKSLSSDKTLRRGLPKTQYIILAESGKWHLSKRYRVLRKNCAFFTIHCNPSLAYIVVRDLQSAQRNASVQSLLLAGNFWYNQSQPSAGEGKVANFRKLLDIMNTL